jgi:hypothetical protein
MGPIPFLRISWGTIKLGGLRKAFERIQGIYLNWVSFVFISLHHQATQNLDKAFASPHTTFDDCVVLDRPKFTEKLGPINCGKYCRPVKKMQLIVKIAGLICAKELVIHLSMMRLGMNRI